jgi:hypothetical protein
MGCVPARERLGGSALFVKCSGCLHFVVVYDIQPVTGVFFEPTLPVWFVIALLRSAGWYLYRLIFAFVSAAGRIKWPVNGNYGFGCRLSPWVLFRLPAAATSRTTSLPGDLFLWQALRRGYLVALAGRAQPLAGAHLTNRLCRVRRMVPSRYTRLGRLPFEWTVVIILGGWTLIGAAGWLRDRRRNA